MKVRISFPILKIPCLGNKMYNSRFFYKISGRLGFAFNLASWRTRFLFIDLLWSPQFNVTLITTKFMRGYIFPMINAKYGDVNISIWFYSGTFALWWLIFLFFFHLCYSNFWWCSVIIPSFHFLVNGRL